MEFKEFINNIQNRLEEELPAFESHKKMVPQFKGTNFRNFKAPKDAKNSAVLILLIEKENDFEILFTLRSEKLNSHKGQISFPGGRQDEGETFEETALRETFEEVGIMNEKINVIGRLSPLYVPPSNSIIQPILAWTKEIENIKLSEDEVQEVFFVDLNKFLDKSFLKKEMQIINGIEVEVPFWDVHPTTKLWGATAIILQEFLDILNN